MIQVHDGKVLTVTGDEMSDIIVHRRRKRAPLAHGAGRPLAASACKDCVSNPGATS
jgi:hypothetical protein